MAKNLLKKIKKSQQNAIKGILIVYKSELSFRIQFWFAIIVITQAFYWPIGEIKVLIILLLTSFILAGEILNTTFEKLFDEIEIRYRAKIRYLKDILAGAVFLIAIFSSIIGFIIFWPYILKVILFALTELLLIIVFIYSFQRLKKLIKH